MLTRPLQLSSPGLRYVAWALDNAIITLIAWLVYNLYIVPEGFWDMLPVRYVYILLGAALMLGALSDSLYRSWRVNDLINMLSSVAKVWGGVVVVIMLGIYLSKSALEISRFWFMVNLMCSKCNFSFIF